MSANGRHPFRKTINWLSRRIPPVRSPFFSVGFAAIMVSLALWVLPLVPAIVLNDRFWGPFLGRSGLDRGLVCLIYILQGFLVTIATCFLARCVELCWPETFDPFQDKHF